MHTHKHTHVRSPYFSRLLSICLWRIEHESSWHTMEQSTEHKGINRILKFIRSKQTQNLNCIVDDEVYIASEFNGINTLTLKHPIQNNNNNNNNKKRCTHTANNGCTRKTLVNSKKNYWLLELPLFLRNVFFSRSPLSLSFHAFYFIRYFEYTINANIVYHYWVRILLTGSL